MLCFRQIQKIVIFAEIWFSLTTAIVVASSPEELEAEPELLPTLKFSINSPFNNVANQDDPCEYYKLCQFETKFGRNLDEYHIACGKCREENDYYMAVDFEESQVKDEDGWMCTNENPAGETLFRTM